MHWALTHESPLILCLLLMRSNVTLTYIFWATTTTMYANAKLTMLNKTRHYVMYNSHYTYKDNQKKKYINNSRNLQVIRMTASWNQGEDELSILYEAKLSWSTFLFVGKYPNKNIYWKFHPSKGARIPLTKIQTHQVMGIYKDTW